MGFGIVTKNFVGCRILVKKEQEYGIRTPLPDPVQETWPRQSSLFYKLEACEASP